MDVNQGALLKVKQVYKKYVLRKRVDIGLFYARGRDNIGDSMVPWLMRAILGRELPYSNPREARGSHLFTIGSILQFADRQSIVWGSGFVGEESRPHGIPKLLAVRGPLTASRIEQLGGDVVKVYGDPALLTPRYLDMPNISQEFRVGLVPHYADAHKLQNTTIVHERGVAVCNVETSSIRKFIESISKCDIIVSSSLHGIILAEAFGIPAIWAKFDDDDVVGKGFKFFDYYASTGRSAEAVSFYSLKVETVAKRRVQPPTGLHQIADRLLDVLHGEVS